MSSSSNAFFKAVVLTSLTILVLARTGTAQQASQSFELKDPETAKTYALYFSGFGHVYTGEYVRAGIMFGTTVFAGYKLIDELACQTASNAFLGADMGCSTAKKFMWLGLAVAPYIYGILDAKNSAERVNAQLQGKASARTGLLMGPDGRLLIALQITSL